MVYSSYIARRFPAAEQAGHSSNKILPRGVLVHVRAVSWRGVLWLRRELLFLFHFYFQFVALVFLAGARLCFVSTTIFYSFFVLIFC